MAWLYPSFTTGFWHHAIDIIFCSILLRVLIGWLISDPKLVRFLLTIIVLAIVLAIIWSLGLPLAEFISIALIIPIVFLLLLSFLPELSRLYAAASRGSILNLRQAYGYDMIHEVAGAIFDLIEKRRGAILVFQRKDSVTELVSGGEPIDAIINRALLLSIFDPHSPGHDGAALLRGNRIDTIASVLPLASADISRPVWMGTRHLAALGLSERCDADILVISEERGTLSHAHDGEIDQLPVETHDQLEKLLQDLLIDDEEETREFYKRPKFIGSMLWFFSILIAFIGSFAIGPISEHLISSNLVSTPVNLDVSFSNLPDNYFVDQLSPPHVKAYVRIPAPRFFPSLTDNLNLNINVAGMPTGKMSLHISSDMVKGLPPGSVIDQIIPESLSFQLLKAKEVTLKIEPRITGLDEKFRYSIKSVKPNTCHALIKQARVRDSIIINTFPIELSNVNHPGIFTYEAYLDMPASIKPTETNFPDKITVEIEISNR